MLSIKDGSLKLNIRRDWIELLWDFSIVLIFLSATTLNGDKNRFNYMLYWGSFLLFAAVTLAVMLFQPRKSVDIKIFVGILTIWYGIFFAFSMLSVLWAASFSSVINMSRRMLQVIVIGYGLTLYVKSEADVYKILRYYVFSCLCMTGYSFIFTPTSQWFTGSFGNVTGHNTNGLGIYAAMAVVICIYFALLQRKKIYYVFAAVNFIMTIMSTSRKALIFAVIGSLILGLCFTNRRNYFLSTLTIIAIVIGGLYMVFNLEVFHVAAARFEKMFSFLLGGDETADGSISVRMYYIDMAKQMLSEHPVLGVGLNNFAYILQQSNGPASYAHNNYMEIAADLGILGLIAYYWFYAYLIIKLFLQMIKQHKISALFFTLFLMIAVMEYGIVSYYLQIIQIMVALSYIAVCISDGEEKEFV